MANTKHEEYEKKNEKWRKASNKAIDIRYALDDMLNSFTDKEKESIRYKQFIDTVSQQFDHLLGDIHKNRLEEEMKKVIHEKANLIQVKKKNGWLSYKSAIIAATGAIVVQLIQSIPQIITTIASVCGGIK